MPKGRKPTAIVAIDDPRSVSPRPSNADKAFHVVGIGASAGGLDASTKLVAALKPKNGMAFVLIQHLDPTHPSMMVELLARHTTMVVLQATDGMSVEKDHLYVIPPGTYLSVCGGVLHLLKPETPHGVRLPFDFFLRSLAKEYGKRAVGVVLSGTGADGSLGLAAIKAGKGLIIAQEPDEAEYDGMPSSAIATGVVDLVLPVAKIPNALEPAGRPSSDVGPAANSSKAKSDSLPVIIDLLRRNTAHDFTLYKMGTLQRRVERRMALASIPVTDMANYLTILESDAGELNLLAADLLINVTSFFRDANVFEMLANSVVPEIVRRHNDDGPLRIWIVGCSTGEETYSLAMIFAEAIAAAKRTITLCVFASDVDADAVAKAREGYYPASIATDITPARLARFFVKQDLGYQVVPALRANVVFTTQDLLTDPPFSRLDMVSCRNLLIYLGPDAQAKATALFHFALRQGGILLLGTSETIGHADGQFETVAKSERIYRRIGKNRPGAFLLSKSGGDGSRVRSRPNQESGTPRQPALADLCRRLVLESYAPAAVLINRRHDCLYSMGPIERYLRVVTGYPTLDLLAMATPGLRTKLRQAISQVSSTVPQVQAPGGRSKHDRRSVPFDIDIRSVFHDGEELLLVGFIDWHGRPPKSGLVLAADNGLRVTELEHDLDVARTDLSAAMHDLELSDEEHRAVNEEALSVNEEYQSANEELLTSKEEMQSLNEELTALNGQLQETLERQRTTSNDLQNVLYSTDVATLFLDTELKIRFFTPATKALFNLIPGDIGRPLADLQALSSDPSLTEDVQAVLHGVKVTDCEVEAAGHIWFMRRILPYRTDADGVEGVVITFTDITERKTTRKALELAKLEAEQANRAKSRFLAAASHDLRQPLQSLALVQGLLAKAVESDKAQALIERLRQSVVTMSAMLNTMLDINQIEAGVVRAAPVDFVIGDLLERARREFAEQADSQGLELRVIRSNRVIHSDPAMIKQMLRNLISNALKYTKQGKILLGCRQQGDVLRIEVWDTGMGIAAVELDAIFEEYHQIDNVARDRSLGLGLGLSIVQRLGRLLGHRVGVRSLPGRGSVFSIEIVSPPARIEAGIRKLPRIQPMNSAKSAPRTGTILIVDDDPELLDLLVQLLTAEGHRAIAAVDGVAALDLIAHGALRPDLILADFNLPNGMTGLQFVEQLRHTLHRALPAIILTGDISTEALRAISGQGCVQLNKPVDPADLAQTIQLLLPAAADQDLAQSDSGEAISTIFIVDDDSAVRAGLREVLEGVDLKVEDFADCESFLASYQPAGEACLLIDAYLPGMKGVELLKKLRDAGHELPAIMITGSSDIPIAVQAMKAGATDFIEKPVGYEELLASVRHALELSRDAGKSVAWRLRAKDSMAGLTQRQQQILEMVLAGNPSKNIAADLGISQRTVENHRATIMHRTGAGSLPELARLAVAADWHGGGAQSPQR